ncbi:hypothetical protein B296_00035007 [Ensete ventricosum]|uniref:Uncharacterized protein n=1 Tax=Ensete ventricosum TaxID=4639 RepID=A0A426ZYL9_ENSVE|nr:hypothetical protein B296_00035007 [Ensete ventricosum]
MYDRPGAGITVLVQRGSWDHMASYDIGAKDDSNIKEPSTDDLCQAGIKDTFEAMEKEGSRKNSLYNLNTQTISVRVLTPNKSISKCTPEQEHSKMYIRDPTDLSRAFLPLSDRRGRACDVDIELMSINMKEGYHCVVNYGEDVTTVDFDSDVSLAEKEGAGMAGSWCGMGQMRQNGWSISCHWTTKERIEAPDLERDGPRSLWQQMSERAIAAERDSQLGR